MKFLIIFAVVIASAAAVPYGGMVNTGSSAVSRSEDGLGGYAFGYNEDHATGGTFRKEKGGPGVQVGSYGLRDADGRMRVVNYVADAHGFRATVSTNEPGVDPKQDPAATSLTYGGHAAPLLAPIIAHAPIAHAPAISYSHAGPLYGDYGYHGAPHAASYSVATAHASPLYGGHSYGHGAPLDYGKGYY